MRTGSGVPRPGTSGRTGSSIGTVPPFAAGPMLPATLAIRGAVLRSASASAAIIAVALAKRAVASRAVPLENHASNAAGSVTPKAEERIVAGDASRGG